MFELPYFESTSSLMIGKSGTRCKDFIVQWCNVLVYAYFWKLSAYYFITVYQLCTICSIFAPLLCINFIFFAIKNLIYSYPLLLQEEISNNSSVLLQGLFWALRRQATLTQPTCRNVLNERQPDAEGGGSDPYRYNYELDYLPVHHPTPPAFTAVTIYYIIITAL